MCRNLEFNSSRRRLVIRDINVFHYSMYNRSRYGSFCISCFQCFRFAAHYALLQLSGWWFHCPFVVGWCGGEAEHRIKAAYQVKKSHYPSTPIRELKRVSAARSGLAVVESWAPRSVSVECICFMILVSLRAVTAVMGFLVARPRDDIIVSGKNCPLASHKFIVAGWLKAARLINAFREVRRPSDSGATGIAFRRWDTTGAIKSTRYVS